MGKTMLTGVDGKLGNEATVNDVKYQEITDEEN